MKVQFYVMQVNNELYPDKDVFAMGENRWSSFDKVNGTDQIRKLFSKNYRVSDIEEYLDKDIDSFRTLSQKYYLYK